MDYSKYFPVREYYSKYIVPINPNRYKDTSDKMVCPVHNDHDPSLGIVKSKTVGEVCHCFGCNYWGTVVELHQKVNIRHFKKYMSEEEALKDLCRIFGVDYDKLPKEDGLGSKDKGIRQEVALSEALEEFDIGDFGYLIRKGKMEGRGLAYYNALMMTMVDRVKEAE